TGCPLARGAGRFFVGSSRGRWASGAPARMAGGGGNPLSPRQSDDDASDSACQNHGEALFGEAGLGHGHERLGEYAMSNKMWGGRFASGPGPIMEELNASIDFYRHLYR